MNIVIHHIHDDAWLHRFAGDFPDYRWALTFTPGDLERAIVDAEILLITNRAYTPAVGAIVRGGPALRWIHFLTAGMDNAIRAGLPPNVAVSYSAGVKASLVAEHAMALLLALVRQLPRIGAEQRAHRWMREEISAAMGTLEERTVCVVGLGNLGRDVARKLKAFGARPIAVSRASTAGVEVAEVFPRARLHDALALSDAVVMCTQADAGSFHMIDAAALAALKPGAYLVNVARGSLVDEGALTDALRSGRLAGAALDVQETEPLSATSPLWDLPNVIVSPHSAGAGSSGYAGHRTLFAENLGRFLSGRELVHPYQP